MKSPRLVIRNFAQIAEADITFGDLTVLVGAQGTGKSLALQWLKWAVDRGVIARELADTGANLRYPGAIANLYFGSGMASAERKSTSVTWDGKAVHLRSPRGAPSVERLTYVPAHRATLINSGWAMPSYLLGLDMPYVARRFSQDLNQLLNGLRPGEDVFPVYGKLKDEIRTKLDEAVFHGARVVLDNTRGPQGSLRLRVPPQADARWAGTEESLAIPTWTTGQRELAPLILGLYDLLPAGGATRHKSVEWVVIEEPEMGLHPQAISAVFLLALELVSRGYRVVMSTHSSHVLTGIWMLRIMQEHNARWQLFCQAFGVPTSQPMQKLARAVLSKEFRSVVMSYGEGGQVFSKDISSLDPADEDDDVSGWGGLTEFSSRFGDAVRKTVNERAR